MLLNDEQRQFYRDMVKKHINDYAIHRVAPGEPLMLGKAEGTLYSSQFYLSQATLFRHINIAISHLALDKLHDLYLERPFQIAGLDTDGIAIALGMLMVSGMYEDYEGLHMIRVRKERKEYGKQNIIEGVVKKDTPILFIDDLMSSKNTLYNAFYRVRDEEGLEVLDKAFAVIHKVADENERTDKYFNEEMDNVEVYNLFDKRDFDLDYYDYYGEGYDPDQISSKQF